MRNEYLIDKIITLAIEEDVEKGDVTTNSLVPESTLAVAEMTAKADGVISGIYIARMVFERFDKNIRWLPSTTEGGRVKKGDSIVRIEGSYRALLTGERTALNILQRMSGIANQLPEEAGLSSVVTELLC